MKLTACSIRHVGNGQINYCSNALAFTQLWIIDADYWWMTVKISVAVQSWLGSIRIPRLTNDFWGRHVTGCSSTGSHSLNSIAYWSIISKPFVSCWFGLNRKIGQQLPPRQPSPFINRLRNHQSSANSWLLANRCWNTEQDTWLASVQWATIHWPLLLSDEHNVIASIVKTLQISDGLAFDYLRFQKLRLNQTLTRSIKRHVTSCSQMSSHSSTSIYWSMLNNYLIASTFFCSIQKPRDLKPNLIWRCFNHQWIQLKLLTQRNFHRDDWIE